MKKTLLLLTTVLLCFNAFRAKADVNPLRLDSIYRTSVIDETWNNSRKYYTYNLKDQISNTKLWVIMNDQWVLYSDEYMIYDENNRVSELKTIYPLSNTVLKYEYTYTSAGELETSIEYYGDLESQDPQIKRVYTYDKGRLIKNDRYDYKGGEWKITYTDLSVFSEDGQYSEELSYSWDEIGNKIQTGYGNTTYNGAGIVLYKEVYYESDGYITDGVRVVNEVNEMNKITESVSASWFDGTWYEFYKEFSDYDSNGHLICKKEYNKVSDYWIASQKYEYSVDNYGNILKVTESRGNQMGEFEVAIVSDYYYTDSTVALNQLKTPMINPIKQLRDGQIVILIDGKEFTLSGRIIK